MLLSQIQNCREAQPPAAALVLHRSAPLSSESPQTIGILGSEVVGRTLAAGLADAGYSVVLGTRTPTEADLVTWNEELGQSVTLGTNEQAAKHGDIVIVATRWEGTENALKLAKLENFAGKVVLDATNPLGTRK